MTHRFAMSAMAAVVVLAGACTSPASSPSTSGNPSRSAGPTSSPAPSVGAIAHPTGAADIILRYDVAGGFVPASFFAAHVPNFTLYGNGTIVWVGTSSTTGAPGDPSTGQPVRTGRFSEDQVQALLAFALGEGGLGIARASYEAGGIADAPSTTFTINADGGTKTVSVYALGMGEQAGPDDAIRARFMKLVTRLGEVDANGSAGVAYQAQAFDGVLEEASGVQGVAIRDWPWTSIRLADFVLPSDPNAYQRRLRRLTPDEAAALSVPGYQNGITGGLYLSGSDGNTYSLALRPLLPDELG